jgi:ATP-dependent protease HslVU (ClpYQ) peptidase subunit
MSVIVWDGKTVAADRQGTRGDVAMTVTKLHRLKNGNIGGFAGNMETSHLLVDWYNAGAKPDDWPVEVQMNEDLLTEFVLFTPKGAFTFGQLGRPMAVETCPMAWGSGSDLALGAMEAGAGVVRAVEIACKFNVYCGMGVDVAVIKQPAKARVQRS